MARFVYKFKPQDYSSNRDNEPFAKALHGIETRFTDGNKAKDFIDPHKAHIDEMIAGEIRPDIFEALEGGDEGKLTKKLLDLDTHSKGAMKSGIVARLFGKKTNKYYQKEQPPLSGHKDLKGAALGASVNREVVMPVIMEPSTVWNHEIAKDEKNKKILSDYLGKELIAEPEGDSVLTYAMGFLEEKVPKGEAHHFIEHALGVDHPKPGKVDDAKERIELLKTPYDEIIDAHQKIKAKIGNKKPSEYLHELQDHRDAIGDEHDISAYKKAENNIALRQKACEDSKTTRDAAQATHDAATTDRDAAQATHDAATTDRDAAQATHDAATTDRDAAQADLNVLNTTPGVTIAARRIATQRRNNARANVRISQAAFDAAENTFNTSKAAFDAAENTFNTSKAAFDAAENTFNTSKAAFDAAEPTRDAALNRMLNSPYGSAEHNLMEAKREMSKAKTKNAREEAQVRLDAANAQFDREQKRYEAAKHHLDEFEALTDKLAVASREYQREVAKLPLPDKDKEKDLHAAVEKAQANAVMLSEAVGGGSYNKDGKFTDNADPKKRDWDTAFTAINDRTIVKDWASVKKHTDALLKAEEEKEKKANEHHEVHKITSQDFLYKIYLHYITTEKKDGGALEDGKKLTEIEKRKFRQEALLFTRFAISDAKDMSVFAANKARAEALAKKLPKDQRAKFLPDFEKILETFKFINAGEARPFAKLNLKKDTSRAEIRHMIKHGELQESDIPLLIGHIQKVLEGHENQIVKSEDIPFVMAMIRNLRLVREEMRFNAIMKKPGKFDDKLKEVMAEDNAIDEARDSIDEAGLFTAITDKKFVKGQKEVIVEGIKTRVRNGELTIKDAMKELKDNGIDAGRGTWAKLLAIRTGQNVKNTWKNAKGRGPFAWAGRKVKGGWASAKKVTGAPKWFMGTFLGKALNYSLNPKTMSKNYSIIPPFLKGGHGHGGGDAHGGGEKKH